MRIAMISEHASPLAAFGGVDAGGQNRHVADLASTLGRHGHAVTVYTRRDDERTPTRVRADGYDVVHVPAGPPVALEKDALLPYMDEFGHWLSQRWRSAEPRPDVIHAHFWMSGVAATRAAGRLIPVVLTYHALGAVKRRYQAAADTSPAERLVIEARLGQQVDRVIAQCRDEAAELARMGVPADRVEIIPSGVDIGRFSLQGPSADRMPGHTRVLAAGRLVPRKGFDDLIHAVALLPGTELVVLGGSGAEADDPEARRLLDLAAQLDVSHRVNFPGAVAPERMPEWYRSADVVACTPWYEPFGLTPLEAMACGVPVVTYAVGGLRESVVDGLTGLHVEPGDVDGLAHALHAICSDAALRERFAHAASHRVRAFYTWGQTATRLAEAYSVAISQAQTEEVVS